MSEQSSKARAINCGLKFIDKASKLHNNKYTYNKTIYTRACDKSIITCPDHGNFLQTPNKHLGGRGCPKCRDKSNSRRQQNTLAETIVLANKKHNNRYKYLSVERDGRRSYLNYICPIHGKIRQRQSNHLEGHGCKHCSQAINTGIDYKKPAILYHFKIYDVYKIGITTTTLKDRYNTKEYGDMELLWMKNFNTAKEAFNEEQRLLKKYADYKYVGEPLLSSGNSELLTCMIINNYK